MKNIIGSVEQLPFVESAETKKPGRRRFITGMLGTIGTMACYGGDVLATEIRRKRKRTEILPLDNQEAKDAFPDTAWVLFPGFKTTWEESQWLTRSLEPALEQRGQLACLGYSNDGLNIHEIYDSLTSYIAENNLSTLYFYGHSMGGMVATEIAAKIRQTSSVDIPLIMLDSSPSSDHDVLDRSMFDWLVRADDYDIPIPSSWRGIAELAERIQNKNERTFPQIIDQTMEQLSPIACSTKLMKSQASYITHFEPSRFANQLGDTRLIHIGNPQDKTVDYYRSEQGWRSSLPNNYLPTNFILHDTQPAHASPQWNPDKYQAKMRAVQSAFLPLPKDPYQPQYY